MELHNESALENSFFDLYLLGAFDHRGSRVTECRSLNSSTAQRRWRPSMKSLWFALATIASTIQLSVTPALAVTFDFSFTSTISDANNIAGTVTGQIILADGHTTGPATVFLTSYPAGLSNFCTVSCLVTAPPWTTWANDFYLGGGIITNYVLNTQLGAIQFILVDSTGGEGLLRWNSPGGIRQVYSEYVSIGVSQTPLPAALPLFATGLGVTWLLARRRKRLSNTIAAA